MDLHWKRPQRSGQGFQSEGSVQISRATHTYTYPPNPRPLCLCDQGTESVLALSHGLVKLNHSCWMCPEEDHKQGRRKGAFHQTQCYCYCGFFILLRGFFGSFGTATAVLQGQGKHRKQYMLYPGTRGKFSLHPINGGHPLCDDCRASVLPCPHTHMLSMLTKRPVHSSSCVFELGPEVS